ncbi:hypothetical protein [Niveispirillum sp. KHB5.9]|uniref:hypothetical protein n=1 Tax=Niveispirillum sp. KHB5.9 TaxID=3400269 RepID=UPI003A8BE662
MRKITLGAGIAAGLVLLVGAANFFSATLPVSRAIGGDDRNGGISAYGYHQYLLLPGTLVFDVRDVGGGVSPLDMTRALLQTASAMKGRRFEKVILAYRGSTRYVMSGSYFQELGRNFNAGENPLYLMRTLPQNLRKPDGRDAFSTWTGGVLGVLTQQMDDFSDFHKQWWMFEAAARRG